MLRIVVSTSYSSCVIIASIIFWVAGIEAVKQFLEIFSLDSVSQIVLGAAVSEAVIGKYVGRKALPWGAVAATRASSGSTAATIRTRPDSCSMARLCAPPIFPQPISAIRSIAISH